MGLKRVICAGIACALAAAAVPARAADKIEFGLIGAANSAEWEFYVGIHQGFFAAAGIDPEIIYVPTAPGLVQQLAAGSLDAVDIGVVEPIHAVSRGAPVAILRVTGAEPLYELVAKSTINSIKDLKGHTVVIGGLLDINRVYLERVLKAAGLKDSDIDITVSGSTASRFAALQSGSADMTMLAPPINFFAEAAGFKNIGMMIDYAKDLPFGSTDVSLAFAEKHHDAVVHLKDAINKSIAWFNADANRDAAIDLLAGEMKTAKRDDIAKSYDYLRKIGYFVNDDTVSRKSLESLMNEMTAIGDTDGKVPFDKLLLPGVTKVGD
ncbi:MAG TPA: ABC transporter substrate-binding protein [Stellaceae bacterium]|jgi:NitT/TauT family transport system substrate-binding protein|nr:ABC transporter substrate-binding protein [Stellaceae bacterium]